MILAEFHAHTQFSDGKLSLPDLVDFYGQKGFGCLAVTDHLCEEKTWLGKAAAYLNKTLTPESFPQYIERIREEAERAWDVYKMLLIPGFELTKNTIRNHRSAHILALGVEKFISADLDVLEMSKQIREAGGVVVAAHPVSMAPIRKGNYYLWDRREELREAFDAWEFTDGGFIIEEVVNSGLPKLATSDFHKPNDYRAWKSVLDCEQHPEAVLDAIRKQKMSFRFAA